ncbi:alpha/beta hydrolase [Halobacillus fulvus]|nr:alpha/beta hydrolase [Halobacillus fulvus]
MYKEEWKTYRARDFSQLQFAHYQKEPQQTTALILLHGITAELEHHRKLAHALQIKADVFLPILRGYDQLNQRGDLDYIGQYDDDLFDFLHFVKRKGYERVILAGHSMGCANLLRIIDLNPEAADYYLFLSPFFHPALPVYREESTDQFKPETDVDYTVHEKKAGLLMTLYKMNIHRFSHKTVAEIPDEFDATGRLELSFRLLASRFLEKITKDVFEKVEGRTKTYVGDQDEVVDPEKLKDWFYDYCGQKLEVIEGTDHNHILHHEELHRSLKEWVKV